MASRSPSLQAESRAEGLQPAERRPKKKTSDVRLSAPSPRALVLANLLLLLSRCPGSQATSLNKNSLNPNSSLWDMDFEGLFHSKKILPGTPGSYKLSSLLRSNALVSHEERRRLVTNQNLTQKSKEEQLSCDMLLKIYKYVFMDAFGPKLAGSIFHFHNCDKEVNPPKIQINPLKLLQSKLKPLLLYRVLKVLRDMGVLDEAQQSKAFSLLKKQMLKTRRMLFKSEVKQSGMYLRRMHVSCVLNILCLSLCLPASCDK
ncbi:uncharacterized protein LOC128844027 [Malaclemys terrapin pileata]|uniref:uncharacterized protein LOC128844027 n=1 Tax=Malaclemys terrapin pileata TaxID=2991368 RepID=UPI0023A7A5B8|nr:uncharacterized protein LOC128844027 [Malaclemys terrapin pileata]XP_053897284.1 uncharacterized protein LOC128844027 [Malaclemys terrapin pileata]